MTRWALLALGLALSSGCALWPGSDGPERPELPSLEPALSPETVWRQSVGSGFEERTLGLSPALLEGRLLAAGPEGTVTAYAPESGERLWRTQVAAPLAGGPGGGDGVVLVGTREGAVLALAAASGERLWDTQLSGEILAAPQVADGVAVVHASNGKVYGLNVADGERLWTFERSLPALTLRGLSAPVLVNGLVLVGMADGSVVALVAQDGRPLWDVPVAVPAGRSELERMVDVDGTPVADDRTLYVVAYQGRAAALSLPQGQILWARDLSSADGPAVAGPAMYVSDEDGVVWSLSRRNGASYWRQDALQGRRLSGPVVHGGALAVADDEGYVHWLSLDDGRLLARTKVGSGVAGALLAVDDVLYVLDRSGRLSALTVGAR